MRILQRQMPSKSRDRMAIINDINSTDISNKKKLKELSDELSANILFRLRLRRRYKEPAETTKGIRNILKNISLIPDEIKQMIWLQKLALEYNLSERLLTQELDKIKDTRRRWEERKKQVDRKKQVI